MNTFFVCVTVALVAFANGQDIDEELQCPGGYCMYKHLCPNGTYADDAKRTQDSNLIVLRFGLEIDDIDTCEHYLLKCCVGASLPPLTTPDPVLDDDDLLLPPPSSFECGGFNENGLVYEMKHNDSLAQYAEFPWVVYIRQEKDSEDSAMEGKFVCGGTLISTRYVITTAHNTDGTTNLIARFGEWDISTTNEPFKHQEIPVELTIKHPQYVNNPIEHDIALLYLASDVQYDRHIRPICLPQLHEQFVGQRCIANGWGEQKGVYAKVMKKITLPVIDNGSCLGMLRLAGVGPFFKLRKGFICAGGEAGVDTCKGDGGSPLACQKDDGSFVLAGIVSWGIGCGGYNLPDGIPNGAEVDHSAFARYGEYPWVVAIFQEDEIYGGGTLIHPWFVLTAAHIFKTADNCVARFGEWDLEQDNSPLPKQFIEIQNVIVHPEYQVKGLWNDVVLAHLKREVQYDKHIRPICLPSPTDLFDGQLCTAIGWGMNSSGVQVNVLKRVELPVVPRKSCKQLFAATRLGPFFRLHQSVLCAGGQSGGDMCQGDGGSGLFCPTGSESYVLAGIVSWGLSCHQQDVPGAYVNVAKLVPWINATIEEHV
uniref:Peptidase S1 domain-containing protein n=1 Tax=Anopheles culicifacies TaxID=139723 RepID=A0A182LWW0_9DIPT